MVLPSSSTKVSRVMPRQSQTEPRTRGGSNLDSWLEPKWKQVRYSSSTSIFACIGTLTMVWIAGYKNKVFINLCVCVCYCEQCAGNGAHKKVDALSLKIWCHLPITNIGGTFSDEWNRKNWWQERIPNQRECVANWWEQILRLKKLNSNENSGVENVRS